MRRRVLFQSWAMRALSLLALQICLILGAINIIRHRKRQRKQDLEVASLRTWSTVCFMWCIFSILIWTANTIPSVCTTVSVLLAPGLFYPRIFLSLYQLARLKATFHLKTNMNRNMTTIAALDYPKWMYFALYLYGSLLIVVSFVVPIALFMSKQLETVEQPFHAGCSLVYRMDFSSLCALIIVRIMSYLVWDWFIVGMYIFKLRQVQVRFRVFLNVKTRQKISVLLSRILFLTAIDEIMFLVVCLHLLAEFVPSSVASSFARSMIFWMTSIVIPVGVTVTFVVLHLMMDRNLSDYLLCVRCLRKCGCLKRCCCCFQDLALQSEYVAIDVEQQDGRLEVIQEEVPPDQHAGGDGDELELQTMVMSSNIDTDCSSLSI